MDDDADGRMARLVFFGALMAAELARLGRLAVIFDRPPDD